MLTIDSKACTKCGVEQPVTEFHKHRSTRDGLQAWCRGCKSRAKVEWYAANRARELSKCRAYQAVNAERERTRKRQWYRDNPGKAAAKSGRRRASKLAADARSVDTAALWQQYGGNCPLCFTKIDRSLPYPDPMSASLDHDVPLSKGGTHTQDNLQWTHLTRNVRKGNRD